MRELTERTEQNRTDLCQPITGLEKGQERGREIGREGERKREWKRERERERERLDDRRQGEFVRNGRIRQPFCLCVVFCVMIQTFLLHLFTQPQ